jgi:hypothetical protein
MTPQVAAALWGGLLAGAFALLGAWLAFRREDSRRKYEARVRDIEWARENFLKSYSDGFYYLNKLWISSAAKGVNDKEVRQHASEAIRHLLMLRTFHRVPGHAHMIKTALDELQRQVQDPGSQGNGSGVAKAAQKASDAVGELLGQVQGTDDWPRLTGTA